MEAVARRTFVCGLQPLQSDSSSLAPPSSTVDSILTSLLDPDVWTGHIEAYAIANARRRPKIVAYREVVASGTAATIADAVLAGRHRPRPPAEAMVNKADGRKKRVYQYAPADELLFKIVNRLVQPIAGEATSPHCHSFLPGRGARSAMRALLRDDDLPAKACVRLDVSDYFNSIDPARLLRTLPARLADDEPLRRLLEATLLDDRVVRGGEVVTVAQKGVMAGTPLAPVLSNLYLRALDAEFATSGTTYGRYSDDIVAFAAPDDADALDAQLRASLAAAGLTVNERKSGRSAAGEPWEYLGFRYHAGILDVSRNAQRKFRGKITRLSRKLQRHQLRFELDPDVVTRRFVRRVDRSLYGVPSDAEGFCWATWFFPVLTTDATLSALDAHVQQKIRFAATGRHNARGRKELPYEALRAAGYLPLTTAYWAHRAGRADYDALVALRCRSQSGDERVAQEREEAVAPAHE
jgi:hypothetical protein